MKIVSGYSPPSIGMRRGTLSRAGVDALIEQIRRDIRCNDIDGATRAARRAVRLERRLAAVERGLSFASARDIGMSWDDERLLPVFDVRIDRDDPMLVVFHCPACRCDHVHSGEPLDGWRAAHCWREPRLFTGGYFLRLVREGGNR